MTVGVAGLGMMGAAMAAHLLDHHGALVVWNRDPAKAAALVARGARLAETPAMLAEQCDIVHLSLLDTEVVEAVALGPRGLLRAKPQPGLIIDHSTISVPSTRRLAEKARVCGRTWLDAPVSGGRAGAEAGDLVVFVGGDADRFEEAERACAPFARRVSHMGCVGAGQATKAANQLMVGGIFVLLAEAAVLAERNGVDTARLPDVLKGGFGDSTLLQKQLPRMVAGPERLHGTASVMLKDLALVGDLTRESACATPVSDAVRALWSGHVDAGHGDQDWVTIIGAIRADSRLNLCTGGQAA